MRIFKKLLLVLLLTAGALLAAGALTAIAIVARPQWFLTTGTVTRAVKVFGGAYHPRWKTLDFDISSLSFPVKQVSLRARDLCFENAALAMEGCVKDLDVQVNVRLYFFGVKLTKVSRFIITGEHFTLDQTVGKTAPPPKRSAGLPNLPAALRGFTLEALKVDLPANKIIGAGGILRGGLKLNLDPARSRPLTLTAAFETSYGTVTRHYNGEVTVDSKLLRNKEFTCLDAKGSLKAEDVNVRFQSRVEKSGPGALAFSLSATARMPGRRLKGDFKGSKDGQDLALTGSAGVWESKSPVKSVRLKQFALKVRLKSDSAEWDTLKFDGAFELEPEAFGLKRASLNLAKLIESRLVISASSTPEMLAADHFNAEVSATIKPAKDWYEFSGVLDATVSGRTSQVQGLKISHKLDFGLKVARFKDLVDYLARSPYSVPAPVHVLRGPLAISVKGLGDSRNNVQEFDYEVVSGLAAGRQSLKFRINGKLAAAGLWAPGRSFSNETDVLLQDIALQLPRLDLRGMAAFVPDSRIQTGAEFDKADQAREEERKHPGKKPYSAIRGQILIKTAKPVRLYSNMAKDPVPIEVDIKLSLPPGPMAGTVAVKPFRAVIFRRIASFDHIRLTGRAGSDLMDLDGLIIYKAAEAKILIRLLGTVQKPRVEFESNPPRSQADIMAMLLFGKSPGELDSDQQSSAASAQTAVANSAFGLASLYLLASTPVDYVGYDPVSRTYTVKLRLPGGATLQLGSGGESSGVQLRKRLSSNLAIQTGLINTQSQGNVVTTLLEWYGRR